MDNIQTKPTTSTIKLNNYQGFFKKGESLNSRTKLTNPYPINGVDYYDIMSTKEGYVFSTWETHYILWFKFDTKTTTRFDYSKNDDSLGTLFYADNSSLYGSNKRFNKSTNTISDNPWGVKIDIYIVDTYYRISYISNTWKLISINPNTFTYTEIFSPVSTLSNYSKRGFLYSNNLYICNNRIIKKFNLSTKTFADVFNPKKENIDAIGIVLEHKDEPIIFVNGSSYDSSSLSLFSINGISLDISILGNGFYFNCLNSISINKFEMLNYNRNTSGAYLLEFNYQRDKYFLPISKGSSNIFQKTIFSKDEQKINANTTFSASTNNNYGTEYDSITGSSSINGEFYTFEN